MADEPGVQVSVLGLPELLQGSLDLCDQIEKEAGTELAGLAAQKADVLRGHLPRDSGRLAGSVVSGRDRPGGLVTRTRKGSAYVGYGWLPKGKGTDSYAGPVDFGGYPPGYPFIGEGRYLYPTVLEAGDVQTLADARYAAEKAITTQTWKTPKT